MAEGDDVRPLVHSNGNGIHKANGHSSPESSTRRRSRESEASYDDRLASLEEAVATMRDEFRETRAGFDVQLTSLRNDMGELQSAFARMVELVHEFHSRDPPPPPPQ